MFPLSDCEKAVAAGERKIKCLRGCKQPVRLDLLVPDLTMTDAFGNADKRVQYSGMN